jgi:hypothetical protein
MVRTKFVFLVLIAAVLAVVPAFHNHSLIPTGSADLSHPTICAACVAATARITNPGATISVPLVVELKFVSVTLPAVSADASGPVPSRAPPAV